MCIDVAVSTFGAAAAAKLRHAAAVSQPEDQIRGPFERLLGAVDWPKISKGKADVWLYFYEDFLAIYDNSLRKETGSYYTPPEVVGAMVALVDQGLKRPGFGLPRGLADDSVPVADPATGTGTFVLGVLRHLAACVRDDEGEGAVPASIESTRKRLVAFELQLGPFAVAQLRLPAEVVALTGTLPKVAQRIFQGVQQPVCIVLAARYMGGDKAEPARVRWRVLFEGHRQAKFAALKALTLNDAGWQDCPSDGRAPFLPVSGGAWSAFPSLQSLFVYNGSGVMPGRTWVIAPDAESLQRRWTRIAAVPDAQKEALFHPHLVAGKPGDQPVHRAPSTPLSGLALPAVSVAGDTDPAVPPVRYGFRSFDRQWLLPDVRRINRPNPQLWQCRSETQAFITLFTEETPTGGPALTLTGLIPDLHHYKGSFGGRVFPLWADAAATQPNLRPALLAALATVLAHPVSAEDLFAYVAAGMPDVMSYDASQQRLHIDSGFIEPVPPAVWHYQVSGKQVLVQWFSYRKKNRERPIIGDRRPPSPLGEIQPDCWLAEYTTELLNLLNVLGGLVDLEPAQSALLDRICTGRLIADVVLRQAGVFAVTEAPKRKPAKAADGPDLLTDVPSLGG